MPHAFVQSFYKAVSLALVKYLHAAAVTTATGRRFSEKTTIEYLAMAHPGQLNELEANIGSWCLQAKAGKDVIASISNYFPKLLNDCFAGNGNPSLAANFLLDDDSIVEPVGKTLGLDYEFDGGKIEVSTVHSVKGETHAATLLLETFNNGYDIHKLLDFLKGKPATGKEAARIHEAMKVAFVACSRPTHLLCIAIHADTADSGEKRIQLSKSDLLELKKRWEIVDLR